MLKNCFSVIRRKRVAAFLLVVWMIVIFSLSSFPGSPVKYEMPLWLYLERKGAHVFEFFLLAILAWNALRAFFPKEKREFLLSIAGSTSLLYAFLDEIHQIFVPGREGKLTDILYDGGGIVLAIATVLFLTRKKSSKRKSEE